MSVYYHKTKKRWIADIFVNNTRVYLGSFKNKNDAVNVRLINEFIKSNDINKVIKLAKKHKKDINDIPFFQELLEFGNKEYKKNETNTKKIKSEKICKYCKLAFVPKFSKDFCCSMCDFFWNINKEISVLNEKLKNKTFKCKVCGKNFNIDLIKKTNYPYCSLKCNNNANIKDTKTKVKKEIKLISEIHHNKITNKQITKHLRERILNYWESVEQCVNDCGSDYVPLKNGVGHVGRLSKAYKRNDIKDLFVRSSWEANVIRCLNHFKIKFDYEPEYFKFPVKKGNRYYLPDLYLTDYEEYWEIKGYMDKGSKTKIKRFRKYYPQHNLYLFGKNEYNLIKDMGYILKYWEFADKNRILKKQIIKKEFK